MTQGAQGGHAGFHLKEAHGALVVTFAGPKLPFEAREPLYRLVEAEGRPRLVLNFENVRVLTSAPIGVLVNLRKKAVAAGGFVRLCNLDPDLMDILRLTHTADLFEIFDDERGALGPLPTS